MREIFGEVTFIEGTGECAFITESMTEAKMLEKIASLPTTVYSRIRFL